jgi:hypothetical protein
VDSRRGKWPKYDEIGDDIFLLFNEAAPTEVDLRN